ncbi:MAG: PAS domain-containing protein, partial [Myxococcales bacterium]|nr:PAS domain-containing protein [Myxococcales bacterium]
MRLPQLVCQSALGMAICELMTPEVLGSLHEGCQVIDFDWRYLYVNDALLQHAEKTREELIGNTMMECYPGIDETPMFERLRRSMLDRVECSHSSPFARCDGSRGWFELRFIPVPRGVCVLSLDVTATKRAAEELERVQGQLKEASRYEIVGRQAGEVAHDLINLLSVIAGLTDLIAADLPEGALKADIDEVRSTALSAVELTRKLSVPRTALASARETDEVT